MKMSDSLSINYAIANRFFAIEIHELNGKVSEETDGTKFFIYTLLQGEGEINYKNCTTKIKAGDTVLLPASLGNYSIEGNLKAIKSYIPNLRKDVVLKLKAAGFNDESIYSIIANT